MNKIMVPKLVIVVLDKLNESNEKTPGMRSVNYQSFKKNPEM